jgi:hypothetical protein
MASELRKRVADLMHSEHRVSPTKLHGLSSGDTAELHAIASGERSSEHRIKALSVLVETGEPAAGDVCRAALGDRAAGLEVRAAGATSLSRLGGMAAEGALLESLPAEETPIVQHKIVAGLARVGREASLRRLADATQAMNPAVRQHAEFARAVIAYRMGTPGYELPVIDPAMRLPAPGEAVSSTAEAHGARPEVALRLLHQIAGDSYGVIGEHDTVTLFEHGLQQKAAVINRAVVPYLRHQPAIVGLVALRADADGVYATDVLVVTWPKGPDGVWVSMNRLAGRPMYFGEGWLEAEGLRFRVDAVRGPGAIETTATGIVVGGRVADLQLSTGRALERRQPTPVQGRWGGVSSSVAGPPPNLP